MPRDKVYHLVAGLVIGFLGGLLHPLVGLGLAVAAGVGKEVYDKQAGGTVEVMDAVATFGGGLVGALAAYFIVGA